MNVAGGYTVPISHELLMDFTLAPPLYIYLLPENEKQIALLQHGFAHSVGPKDPSAFVAEGLEDSVRWDNNSFLHYLSWDVPDCFCECCDHGNYYD